MASIDRALADPLLFGTALGDPSTWATWRVVLKAAFALGLTEAERATFSEIAGGRHRLRTACGSFGRLLVGAAVSPAWRR